MKILIVYRDCSLQETLAQQFSQRGYDVLCIGTGEVADLLQGLFAAQLAERGEYADGIVIDAASFTPASFSGCTAEGSLKRTAEGSLNRAAEGSSNPAAEGFLKHPAEGSSNPAAEGPLKHTAEGSSNRAAEGSLKRTAEGSSNRAAEGSSSPTPVSSASGAPGLSANISDRGQHPIFDEASFSRLVDWCAQRRWQFVMLSDSRVFPAGGRPSRGQQRYREVDATQPGTVAGAALAERERYLAAHWERHVILRTGPLIAATGDNLLTDLLHRLRLGEALAGAQEARFAPTPGSDLARVLVAMCDQLACNARCWGVYHYHSSDPATGYEFAEVVLAAAAQYWAFDADRPLLQASIDDPLAGLYPLLNCQRIRDTFGIQQLPWRKAIPNLLKTIYAGESNECIR